MKTINLNKIIRSNILNLSPYTSARDEFENFDDSSYIFLDANENPFENNCNRYPDPLQWAVKKRISELKNIPIKNIFLGNGSDEILDLIIRSCCEPNLDNILTFIPTYGMYDVLANINAIKNNKILLKENFQMDLDLLFETINANTKIIFICSPNNPTGNNIDLEDIKTILNRFEGIVVVDEAYIDFSENESLIKLLPDYENLIVCQTFSKAYGMAGIRLGMCFASESILKILNAIKPPYNINSLTQTKILERLENISEINVQINTIIAERTFLIENFKKINWIKKIYPSNSNFILIEVDDANLRYKNLLEQEIVVRNRNNDPLCKNCLRISIGTPKENKKLLEVFYLLSKSNLLTT